jgi:hypothetical protein
MKTIIKILTIAISFSLTACPQKQSSQDDAANLSTVEIEQELAKTSTGQDSVNYLNSLRQNGYYFEIALLSTEQLQSKNGHTGGGFARKETKITIFINKDMPLNDRVHAFAHELVHIKDDFEIENTERNYPYIKSAVANLLTNYKQHGINSFDNNVVGYVLNTLFCTEVRAYTKNVLLAQQGISTQAINTSNVGAYVNQNYIVKDFNVTYGTNSEPMKDWCLKFNSMAQIQDQLIW